MIIIKKLITTLFFLVLAVTLGLVGLYNSRVREAKANGIPHVPICHCATADNQVVTCRNLNLPIPAAISHLQQHDNDHPGSCQGDVCENLDGIQENTPEGWENDDGYCYEPRDLCENLEGNQETLPPNYEENDGQCSCQKGYHQEEYGNNHEYEIPECVPDEEPTPTPTEPPVVTSQPGPAGPPPVCEGRDLGGYAPTIYEVGRIDSDTVFARWTASTPNADDYILWYGLSQDNLPWNVKVENSQYAEVSGEQLTGHVWFRVQATDNCVVGLGSAVVDP